MTSSLLPMLRPVAVRPCGGSLYFSFGDLRRPVKEIRVRGIFFPFLRRPSDFLQIAAEYYNVAISLAVAEEP
jgi:hypothetical protein